MKIRTKIDSAIGSCPAGVGEGFQVLGLGLSPECRERLVAAFPQCVLYDPNVARRGGTSELCGRMGGHVVIFLYMPAMLAHMRVRTSTVFNQQAVKVVGIHRHWTSALYDEAMEYEFSGALNEASSVETYRNAARAVHEGELWYPRGYLSRRLLNAVASSDPLSEREGEIMRLLAGGETNQAIGEKLFVSRETVRWHLRAIYTKLGMSGRGAVERYARKLGEAEAEWFA